MKKPLFMVVVSGFPYKKGITLATAKMVKRALSGAVNNVIIVRMPEVVG